MATWVLAKLQIAEVSKATYTAMALSGAQVDPKLLQGLCGDTDHGMSDCAFLALFDIDLHALDLSAAAQDLRDANLNFRNLPVKVPRHNGISEPFDAGHLGSQTCSAGRIEEVQVRFFEFEANRLAHG